MAYSPPAVNEVLYCTKDNTPVYIAPGVGAAHSQVNTAHDHALRDRNKGDEIGPVLDATPVIGLDGTKFYKVRTFVWIQNTFWMDPSSFAFHPNVEEYHESYVKVDDEPGAWIRDSYRQTNAEVTEQTQKEDEIKVALASYPGVPAFQSFTKKTDNQGNPIWVITWPNGYMADFETFKNLSLTSKLTETGGDPNSLGLTKDGIKDTGKAGTNPGNPPPATPGSSLLTTKNVLIGLSVLVLFSVLLLVLRRKKP